MYQFKSEYRLKENIHLVLFIFSVTAILLAVCSKCSFLYQINDWSDVNIYFTIGKSLSRGKVLYVDLIDQKGPLIFFIFNLASHISATSMIGVYILEVISIGSCVYFGMKYIRLFEQSRVVLYAIIPFLIMSLLVSRAFGMGGSAEELCLGFLGYSLFSVLGSVKENRLLTKRELILNGICAACVLWIKYTILGLYIGLVIFVIYRYVRMKKYQEICLAALWFLVGVLIITGMVCFYFIRHGALDELFKVYIRDNFFIYPARMSLLDRCIWILRAVWMTLKINLFFSILIEISFLYFLLKKRQEFLCLFLSFIILAITMYMGGKVWDYYGLVFAPFAVTGGGVAVIVILQKVFYRLDSRLVMILLMIEMILSIAGGYFLSPNTKYIKMQKDDYAQYRFAKEINKIRDAKIINYNCMDRGFFLTTNLVPDCRYYFVMNMNLTEMREEQDSYVSQGIADFVITRDQKLSQFNVKDDLYRYVCQKNALEEGKEYTYYLYKKI